MDIYFINGSGDAFGVRRLRVSARPRHAREMFCLHKKISGRYCHCAQYLVWISGPNCLSSSFYTNGLYHSFNMSMPGLIASQSDFGYTSERIDVYRCSLPPASETYRAKGKPFGGSGKRHFQSSFRPLLTSSTNIGQ